MGAGVASTDTVDIPGWDRRATQVGDTEMRQKPASETGFTDSPQLAAESRPSQAILLEAIASMHSK
jgi:hypothetical protein